MIELTKPQRAEIDNWMQLKGYKAMGELTYNMFKYMRADKRSADLTIAEVDVSVAE